MEHICQDTDLANNMIAQVNNLFSTTLQKMVTMCLIIACKMCSYITAALNHLIELKLPSFNVSQRIQPILKHLVRSFSVIHTYSYFQPAVYIGFLSWSMIVQVILRFD